MSQSEFAGWINPLLDALRELGGSAKPQEVVDLVAKKCHVPDHVLDQTITGGGSRFANQVHWARYYLAEAGYIDRSRRGVWTISDRAPNTGALSETEIDAIIAEVQEAGRLGRTGVVADQPTPTSREGAGTPEVSPAETFAPGDDSPSHPERLLLLLKSLSPSGFERLCQRLLREAGFEQVVVTGRSGDGGIDGNGVLALNAFVSFRVLFQCKRYDGLAEPVNDFETPGGQRLKSNSLG